MEKPETKDPLISVVIPAYNRANTIRRCLDSVLSQTLSPLEVIVVDDCSKDKTAEVVQSYSDPRVRLITLTRNAGAQAARNHGIHEAKGDWIAFQDSDDEWLKDKLEKQVEALRKVQFNPWTVVHCDAFKADTKKKSKHVCHLPQVHGESVLKQLLSSPGPMFQAILTSKEALISCGLLDENIPSYQEWDTSIRLSRKCAFIFIPQSLFIYYIHEGDTISKSFRNAIKGYRYIIDAYKDDIIRECGRWVYMRHLFILLMLYIAPNYLPKIGSVVNRSFQISNLLSRN